MQATEAKKKLVPGTRDIIVQIKQITNNINSIDEEIKSNQDAIKKIYEAERSGSPKAILLNELQIASEARNEVRAEKNRLSDAIEAAKTKIDQLKATVESSSTGYNSIDKINKSLEDLELKLISCACSQKEEADIAAKMTSLKVQREKLSSNENTLQTIHSLEKSMRELRDAMSKVSKDLYQKNEAIKEIKTKLDALNESQKTKSPEVLKVEAKINALRDSKSELMKMRNAKREEVHKIEEEYRIFEAELLVQKQLEEQKTAIRNVISELQAEKDKILSSQMRIDPKVFDSILFTLNNIAKSKTSFSLTIDIVSHLVKLKVKIPSNLAELLETIETLKVMKEEATKIYNSKKSETDLETAAVDAKIKVQMDALNALPETNFDVLRKGGVRVNFRK